MRHLPVVLIVACRLTFSSFTAVGAIATEGKTEVYISERAHVVRNRHRSSDTATLAHEDRHPGPQLLRAEAASQIAGPAGPMSSQPAAWNAECNSSMIGTWQLTDNHIREREFRIFRDPVGNLYLKQVFPRIESGVRTGWLNEYRSTSIRPGCSFEAKLTDGAVLRLLLYRSGALAPETLEVSQTGKEPFSSLATRPPPPAYSVESAAWLVVVLVLFSGPVYSAFCSRLPSMSPTNAVVASGVQAAGADEGKQSHEDWMDVLRFTCIVVMVVRHAVQSLERLGRVPAVDHSWVLHGLPLFMYVAGRGFGASVSTKTAAIEEVSGGDSMKARFLEQAAWVKRRAVQLVLPSVLGTLFVVVPTEYMGRNWRHCAKGPDAPLQWLQVYLFQSDGRAGIRCEGLGWLGFMVSLFAMQAMLRPWATAMHRRVSGSTEQAAGWDLSWVLLWVSSGIVLGSCGLAGDAPIGARAFFRADTALAFAPALADLFTMSIRLPYGKVKGEWQAPVTVAAPTQVSSLARRVVASVALATWTKKIPFDATHLAENSTGLWIELCLLMMFYQQGVADGIFKNAPATRDISLANPLCGQVWESVAKAFEAITATRPGLAELMCALFAWGLWLLVSFVPVAGHHVVGAGFRYPAYCRASAGEFVLRSWIVLGLAVWWFGQHLPEALKGVKTLCSFGFTLYVLHWFFIESVLGQMYVAPQMPKPGEAPWWAALSTSLVVTGLAAAACHRALKVITG